MSRTKIILAALVLLGALGAGGWWWQQSQARLPEGIAFGNGRLEAEQVDIATKFAGRIAAILASEGDNVAEGQAVARMDTAEIEAQIRQAEAEIRRQRQATATAEAMVAQRRSDLDLIRRNLERTTTLATRGFAPQQRVDSEQAEERSAVANLNAAERRVDEAREGVDAAQAAADRLREQMSEATLVAPRAGRVQYRLAQPGEVLPAGGKVLTLLDLTDIHMTIFLPTVEAGRLALGTEARLLLDAVADTAVPGRVTFVAAQAQFTPRQVETRSERVKLMYRVRVHVPPALLRRYSAQVKVGLTGVAYVRLSPDVAWPANLESPLTRQDWWAQ